MVAEGTLLPFDFASWRGYLHPQRLVMSLNPGTQLGPYEILAPLGAGGMGEVYKATDTRLDRTVAVKVLPSHLSDSAVSRSVSSEKPAPSRA